MKTYDNLADTTATVAADLRTKVHNFSARGLQSIAIDPGFPTNPYIYVYYNLDAKIGGTPPLYGTRGRDLRRLQEGAGREGRELHRVGARVAAADRRPGDDRDRAGAGRGLLPPVPVPRRRRARVRRGRLPLRIGLRRLDRELWDYGQTGSPANPCGDPPGTIGSLLSPPTSEGGRLRVQDLRTPATAGDPTGLDGSLIRINPATGVGAPNNPLSSSADVNERRMIGYGLRDSARLAIRPGTSEVWVTDRGGGYWEEFMRVQTPVSSVQNYGYPCYEGGIDANGNPYNAHPPRKRRDGLEHLREPLPRRQPDGRALLGLRPRAAGRPGRELHEGLRRLAGRQPSDRRVVLSHRRRQLPRRVSRRAVLLRSPARLHLCTAAGSGRAAAARQCRPVRGRRHARGRHRGGPGRRLAVRRPGAQRGAADCLHGRSAGQPGSQAPLRRPAPRRASHRSPSPSTAADRATPTVTDSPTSGTWTATASSTTPPPPSQATRTRRRAATPRRCASATGTAAPPRRRPPSPRRARRRRRSSSRRRTRAWSRTTPATNYGTSSTLLVRGGPKLVTESYLRFNVTGITGRSRARGCGCRRGSNGTVDGPAVYTARRARGRRRASSGPTGRPGARR